MMKNIDEISQKAAEILSKEYARRLVPDETGGYVASIQEFPGCIAEGDNAEDAIKNLDKAAVAWVEVALSNGYEIREPTSFHGYSGKIALRIPRGLHKQVAEQAELEETSINQLLVAAISQYLGSKHTFRDMLKVMVSEIQKIMPIKIVTYHSHDTINLLISPAVEKNHPLLEAETSTKNCIISWRPKTPIIETPYIESPYKS